MNVQAKAASRPTILLAATAAIALSMLYLVVPVMANDLHQTADLPISWDNPDFQGNSDECKDADLEPGEVLWHFVHTGNDGSDLPATLDANFETAGDQQADGYSNGDGNATLMYDIITGHDTLNSASDSIDDDNLLNLSHICGGPEQSVDESVAESVEESVAESVEESVAESAEESVAESVAESVEQSVAESVAQSAEEEIEAGTGTPDPEESQPDTALGVVGSNPLPTLGFGLILLASLTGLAFANVKAARNRS
ncbi:MAG: hypothetical protein WD116_04100 [Chloroflexota bacterium]